MFRFFRQIRQKLFQEGKASRYLGYALGEIVLIVVGILIALQISNLNERGRDQQRVRGHLEELKSELIFDLERKEEIIGTLQLHEEAGLYVMDYISGKLDSADPKKLTLSFIQAGAESVFSLSKGAYESLISSGDFELIRNETLKRKLSVLHDPAGWDKIFHDDSIRPIYADYLLYRFEFTEPDLIRNYFLDNVGALGEADPAAYIIPNNPDAIDWQTVKTDDQFRVKLDRVNACRVLQRRYYDMQEDLIRELLDQIDAELAN